MVDGLQEKKDSIYIWCNADFFLWLHNLNGLCCGMYLSDVQECHRYGFLDCDLDLITESNNVFASIMARHIHEQNDELYRNLVDEYGLLAKRNPIAKFNHERLYDFQKPIEDQESKVCFAEALFKIQLG